MLLDKEAKEKGRSLKAQLIISNKKTDEKESSEKVWQNQGFFLEERT